MTFDFLDDEEKPSNQDVLNRNLPHWVSEKNATFKAYKAINAIKLDKCEYILKHKNARAFRTEKSYQVGREEVAQEVQVTRQVLFYTSKYSEQLQSFLDEVNKELDEKKISRLAVKSDGVRDQPKKEVYGKYKLYKGALAELQKKNASEQVSEAISRMSLQTRKALGL